MNFEKNVNRILHDEHMTILNLLNRFDALLAGVEGDRTPDVQEAETNRLLNELVTALEQHVDRHFRFEEEALFPELEEAGEGDFIEALREDHEALQPMAKKVTALVRSALGQGLSGDQWQELVQIGRAYVQDLTVHAEREEVALLPMLELQLDNGKDTMLWQDYALGETPPRAVEQ